MFIEFISFPAVVPILVNVGAGLLPTIIAALGFVVGLLFRPRELCRVSRAHPVRALAVVVVVAGAGWGIHTWSQAPRAPAGRSTEDSGEIDWAQVAREMLQARAVAAATTDPTTAPIAVSDSTEPFIFRTDRLRCGFDGGVSPHNLQPAWSIREPDAMFLSSPAATSGRVYAGSCILDPPGNYGTLFCVDAASGEELWSAAFVGDPATGEEIELKGFFSSPAVTADGKRLIVGQGLHYDTDCSLLCFNTDTGALLWRVPTPLHIESSPAIHGDIVVAGAGAIEDENMRPVSDPGYVIAVRISTGKILWRHDVIDPESSPVIGEDGTVFIGSGFNGKAVVALRSEPDDELAAQGVERLVWKTDTQWPVTGAVTLLDDLVIVGCGNGNYVYAAPNPAGAVIALDRETGEERWRLRTADAVLGAVAVRDGVAVCAIRNGEVIALDLEKAVGAPEDAILWRATVSEDSPVLTGPAFTGDRVYAISKDGYLAVIDATNGDVVERLYINDETKPGELGLCISSPTVAHGRLYVGSETGGMRCLAGGRDE